MCGIAGIFSLHNTLSTGQVKKMTDKMVHRGPDGEGHWSNNSSTVVLGHRRLSIIDLSEKGKQPMHYAHGRYTITFNGEIYNYIEIKKLLLTKGYEFVSDSDTEVLLALYDFKKEKCLNEIDGMFAFAIWDDIEKKLFCARDRFGEKPFFYFYQKDTGFYFASEMKGLWAAGIEKKMNYEMLESYLIKGELLNKNDLSATFYSNIHQLDSSHYLTITTENFIPQIKKYYSIDKIEINHSITKSHAEEQLLSLLTNSVRLRLRSDVPVGSSLSGGIDSSAIVSLVNKIKNETAIQKTFSARFNGFDRDEGYYIRQVIENCKNVDHHEVWPTLDDLLANIDKIVEHQEEPFSSSSIYAQWKVMELAKKSGVSVLLDGQGADEQFAGYLFYYKIYLGQLYHTNYRHFLSEVNSFEKLRKMHHPLHPRNHTFRMRIARNKKRILKTVDPKFKNSLSRSLKKDFTISGLKELLRYADRNSMAHSVEVRLPFLSHLLVEFVFSLPDSFKLNNGWTKLILRETMAPFMPEEVTWRIDKVAYETPQEDWLSKTLNNDSIQYVNQYLGDFGYLNRGYQFDTISEWNYFLLSRYIV